MKEPQNKTVLIDREGDAWQRWDKFSDSGGGWYLAGGYYPRDHAGDSWAEVESYRPFRAIILPHPDPEDTP